MPRAHQYVFYLYVLARLAPAHVRPLDDTGKEPAGHPLRWCLVCVKVPPSVVGHILGRCNGSGWFYPPGWRARIQSPPKCLVRSQSWQGVGGLACFTQSCAVTMVTLWGKEPARKVPPLVLQRGCRPRVAHPSTLGVGRNGGAAMADARVCAHLMFVLLRVARMWGRCLL